MLAASQQQQPNSSRDKRFVDMLQAPFCRRGGGWAGMAKAGVAQARSGDGCTQLGDYVNSSGRNRE